MKKKSTRSGRRVEEEPNSNYSNAGSRKAPESPIIAQFFLVVVLSVFLITTIYVIQVVVSSPSTGNAGGNSLAIKADEVSEYQKIVQEASSLLDSLQHLKSPTQDTSLGNLRANTEASLSKSLIDSAPEATAATMPLESGVTVAAVPPPGIKQPPQALPDSRSDDSNSKKDIVIGMAQDTDPKNLAVFCGSLRKVSQAADLVLFMNAPIPGLHKEIIKKYGAIVVPFQLGQLAETVRTASGGTVNAPLPKYHPSTSRWALIYNYFVTDDRWRSYNRVWMIDVRDSTFQLDPFSFTPPPSTPFFYIFTGVESRTIGQCGWNGGWIRDCFGNQMLQRVGPNNIICSGVSVASMDVGMLYLRLMNDIVLGTAEVATNLESYYTQYYSTYAPDANKGDAAAKAKQFLDGAVRGGAAAARGLLNHQFPRCERNGVDQGVHNVLVHNKLIPHMKTFRQADGPVANMQGRVAVLKNGDGVTLPQQFLLVHNPNGAKVAVAHQYDRYPEYMKNLFGRYCHWDEGAEGVDSGAAPVAISGSSARACEKFELKSSTDLFKGECDLGIRPSSTVGECCQHCSVVRECNSFTFTSSSSTCYLKTCATGANRPGETIRGAVSGWKS